MLNFWLLYRFFLVALFDQIQIALILALKTFNNPSQMLKRYLAFLLFANGFNECLSLPQSNIIPEVLHKFMDILSANPLPFWAGKCQPHSFKRIILRL